MAKTATVAPSANGHTKSVVADDDAYGNYEYDTEGEVVDPGDPLVEDEKAEVKEDELAEEGEKKPEEKAEEKPVEKVVHPKALLRRARDMGLSAAETEALSADDLEDRVYVLEREALAELRGQTKAKPKEEAKPEKAVDDEAIDWGGFEYEFDDGKRVVEEKDISAPLVHVVKSLQKQIRALERSAKERADAEARSVEANFEQQLDTEFNKYPVLGKGKATDVKGTPFMDRRMAVFMRLKAMSAEEQRQTSMDKAVAKIVKDLFEGTAAVAVEETDGKVTKEVKRTTLDRFKEGSVAKPTGRKAQDLPKGRKKAEQSVADWLEENISDDDEDSDSDSEY